MDHSAATSVRDEQFGHTPQSSRRRAGERRLFLVAAVLFPLIVLVGFARTYYLKGVFGTPPLASGLVRAHGIVMTAWVALFVTQVALVRSGRIALHRQLGMAGAGLGALVVIVGFFTAVAAAKYGAASTRPNFPPRAHLVVPFFDLVMMVILFGAAIVLRRRPADHKRLMLLTAVNFLPPALARFPIASLLALGPVYFFGVPTVLALGALGYDRWLTGSFNRAMVLGAVLLIASYPCRLMLSGTGAWMGFATWLTTALPV